MAVETRIVGDGKDALFLLGYGLNFEQPGTKWLMDRFEREGIGTTFVRLPTEIVDFQSDVLAPCKEIESQGEHPVILGLSLGGLTATFLDRSKRRIFLSPFWGVNNTFRHKGFDVALSALKKVRYRMLPRRFSITDAGHYAVEEDLIGIPEMISFSTIYQMTNACSVLPPPKDNDVVYRSKEDMVISHSAIEERGIPIIEYEGGHLIHLVKDRDRLFGKIIETIRSELEQATDQN